MITVIIIIVTCIISIMAFSNGSIIDKLIFYPPAISEQKQWYRFFTCGLIHADIGHLFFNMFCFYSFGRFVEEAFGDMFGSIGKILYILLYVSALLVCLLPSYFKNKHNYSYRSLGASGAVSAVVFASILLSPNSPISIIFLPMLKAPAFIFGILYLIISAILDKRGRGGINHSAHIYGGLYGIVFLVLMSKLFSQYDVINGFIFQVRGYLSQYGILN